MKKTEGKSIINSLERWLKTPGLLDNTEGPPKAGDDEFKVTAVM